MLGILQFRLGCEPGGLEGQRAEIAELAMRALRVVVVPECAQPNSRLGHGAEHIQVQTLVADRPVEPFLLPILLARQQHPVRRMEHNSSK